MDMSLQFKDTNGFVSLESEITTEKVIPFAKTCDKFIWYTKDPQFAIQSQELLSTKILLN